MSPCLCPALLSYSPSSSTSYLSPQDLLGSHTLVICWTPSHFVRFQYSHYWLGIYQEHLCLNISRYIFAVPVILMEPLEWPHTSCTLVSHHLPPCDSRLAKVVSNKWVLISTFMEVLGLHGHMSVYRYPSHI